MARAGQESGSKSAYHGQNFDLLKDDPYEKINLAGKNRKKLNALLGRMRKHIQRAGALPWQRP